jgi:hypothetical protein
VALKAVGKALGDRPFDLDWLVAAATKGWIGLGVVGYLRGSMRWRPSGASGVRAGTEKGGCRYLRDSPPFQAVLQRRGNWLEAYDAVESATTSSSGVPQTRVPAGTGSIDGLRLGHGGDAVGGTTDKHVAGIVAHQLRAVGVCVANVLDHAHAVQVGIVAIGGGDELSAWVSPFVRGRKATGRATTDRGDGHEPGPGGRSGCAFRASGRSIRHAINRITARAVQQAIS